MIIKGLTIAKKPPPFSPNEDRCAVSSVQAKKDLEYKQARIRIANNGDREKTVEKERSGAES